MLYGYIKMHGQQNIKFGLTSIKLYSRINFHIFPFKVKKKIWFQLQRFIHVKYIFVNI